jgi:Vps51/Vps67
MAMMPGLSAHAHSRSHSKLPAAASAITDQDGSTTVTVHLERALEFMSTEEARLLLAKHSADVSSKQAELRSMVSSRYHELIESADSIVAMQQLAGEVMSLLESLPAGCETVLAAGSRVLQPVALSLDNSTISQAALSTSSDTATAAANSTVKLMMNAPSAVWAALDAEQFFEAAALYLRCAAAMAAPAALPTAAGDSNTNSEFDAAAAAFAQTQWACMAQFPGRITSGSKRLLRCESTASSTNNSSNSSAVVGALATLVLLQSTASTNSSSSSSCTAVAVLNSFLQLRGTAIVRAVRRACRSSTFLQEALCSVVTLLHKTVADVHSCFVQGAVQQRVAAAAAKRRDSLVNLELSAPLQISASTNGETHHYFTLHIIRLSCSIYVVL